MYVPMLVDHVGDSEPEEEDWEDVDEVLRGSTCYACGKMEHLARDRTKNGARARRKADMEAMDTPKDKGRRRKAREIKVQAHL